MAFTSRLLENVGEADSARQKWPKKRSLQRVNEHFEVILYAAEATQAVFQQSARQGLLCLLLLLVTACSAPPRLSLPEERESAEEPDVVALELMPDPYLAQQGPLPPQARDLFEQAQQAMEAGDWQQAQAILERMAESWPHLSGPWVNLGLVYRELDDQEKAEKSFERAIAANRLNSEAYNHLAILHRERGDFAEAEKYYQQALEVWPHNPVVHRNLGILYDLYMGRFADALRHYEMSQKYAAQPEREVNGWIVDLERRLAERQAALKQEN